MPRAQTEWVKRSGLIVQALVDTLRSSSALSSMFTIWPLWRQHIRRLNSWRLFPKTAHHDVISPPPCIEWHLPSKLAPAWPLQMNFGSPLHQLLLTLCLCAYFPAVQTIPDSLWKQGVNDRCEGGKTTQTVEVLFCYSVENDLDWLVFWNAL